MKINHRLDLEATSDISLAGNKFSLVANDNLSHCLNISIKGIEAREVEDVVIVFRRPSKSIFIATTEDDIEIRDTVQYCLPADLINQKGQYTAEVKFLQGDTILTSSLFKFYVREELKGSTGNVSDDFKLLKELIRQLREVISRMDDIEANHIELYQQVELLLLEIEKMWLEIGKIEGADLSHIEDELERLNGDLKDLNSKVDQLDIPTRLSDLEIDMELGKDFTGDIQLVNRRIDIIQEDIDTRMAKILPAHTNADLNNFRETGFYYIRPAQANCPPELENFSLYLAVISADQNVYQRAVSYRVGKVAKRQYRRGSWDDWEYDLNVTKENIINQLEYTPAKQEQLEEAGRQIGQLNSLTTHHKEDLVGAINELKENIANIDVPEGVDLAPVYARIEELEGQLGTHSHAIKELEEKLAGLDIPEGVDLKPVYIKIDEVKAQLKTELEESSKLIKEKLEYETGVLHEKFEDGFRDLWDTMNGTKTYVGMLGDLVMEQGDKITQIQKDVEALQGKYVTKAEVEELISKIDGVGGSSIGAVLRHTDEPLKDEIYIKDVKISTYEFTDAVAKRVKKEGNTYHFEEGEGYGEASINITSGSGTLNGVITQAPGYYTWELVKADGDILESGWLSGVQVFDVEVAEGDMFTVSTSDTLVFEHNPPQEGVVSEVYYDNEPLVPKIDLLPLEAQVKDIDSLSESNQHKVSQIDEVVESLEKRVKELEDKLAEK